jgi:predicted  nucleic acid-binding Zn-ribbon protein
MNPRLEQLLHLQRAESELKRVQGELHDLPRRRAELEAALAGERGRLDAAKAALDECQKARRKHEGELQDLETKRSRYKGQLMEVKTNKEYTAMLHEIEGVEREIRSREDLILGEMEKAESLVSEVKREEELFRKEEARHKTEAQALDQRSKGLQEEAARHTAARDEVASRLDADTLELFNRVAGLRGVALAEARDEMCQECHVKLRLQMYSELKRNEDIRQCPNCNRILYYEPPVPVVVPESLR